MNTYLLVFILLNCVWTINCLKCYACSATPFDDRCATNVESAASIINCKQKYCTSLRIEFLEPQGKVQSMIRTCQDKPDHYNEVIEDGFLKLYYRACQEDLCNGGDGRDTLSPNGNVGQGFGVLLVRGTGGAKALSPNIGFLITSTLLFISLRQLN